MEKQSFLNISKRFFLNTVVLIVCSYVLSYLLFAVFPSIFLTLNLQINDRLLKLRYRTFGSQTIYPHLIHVDLTGNSVQKLQISYWDREVYGEIIRILDRVNVDSIIFDILFLKESDPDKDRLLLESTKRSGNVYFPLIYFPGKDNGTGEKIHREVIESILWYPVVARKGKPIEASNITAPYLELSRSAKGLGHINCTPDRDGVFRRYPLIIRYRDGYIPSLSFRAVCDYLEVLPEDIEIFFGKNIVLHDASLPYGQKEDIEIPIDKMGRMIINFAGPWSDSYTHYSFESIVEAGRDDETINILKEEIGGDIVILSDISTAGRDIGTVPFETNYPLSGLHTNVINSIITRNFLKDMPAWAAVLIDAITILLFFYLTVSYSPLKFTILSIGLFIVVTSSFIGIYLFGNKIVNIIRPSIGFIFVLISINAYRFIHEEKEKSILRRTFEHYFAPSLLEKIITMPERLKNSEKKVLTVLFSDIAGFTSWCATQNPEDIRSMLNDYFKEMAGIIFKYEGTIDKFIGDGLMVFFGDPVEHKDHSVRAVKAAIEMQKTVGVLQDIYKKRYNIDFKIRIGINKGEVVVGNMGSESRIDYTVLGSNVNLAQRLENSAPVGGILVSESVFHDVKDLLELYRERSIKVKGIEKELRVFEVLQFQNSNEV